LSSSIATYIVHNHEIDAPCSVQLVEDPSADHIAFVSREWSPILQEHHAKAVLSYRSLPVARRNKQAWQEIQTQFGAPDAHWDWEKKKQSMMKSAQRMYALVDRKSVEALMRLDLTAFSVVRKNPTTPIVYLEYLAVAPWNRRAIAQKPRFKGLGTILLGVAVCISLEEEMDGRCGLHSLPQSEGFYRQAGMNDTGLVDQYGLKYFEFDPEAARKFLED
jgi:hypothetical protein